MVDPADVALSLTRQCRLVSIARSSFYYEGKDESLFNVQLRRRIDEQLLETPFYGSRQMTRWLRRQEIWVSRKRVRRLMRRLGLQAIFQRPRTSQPHPEHRIYPYLLRDLAIMRPNQVWCSDVTYIPLARGFLYLVAVMDWASRKVLAWRLSNTLDSSFCVEAWHEALDRYGSPEIFNTDQGSQFTSLAFTDGLTGRWDPHLIWTARAAGWITSSSSGCGVRSNMSRSIWLSTPPPQMPGRASAGGSISTTSGGRTRRSWTGRPTRRTLWGLLRDRGVTPPHHSPRRPDL